MFLYFDTFAKKGSPSLTLGRDPTVDQTIFDRIMKKKIYNFESVLALSIIRVKNIVIFKKILPFEYVSDLSKGSSGVRP